MMSLPAMIRHDLADAGYTVKRAAQVMGINASNLYVILNGHASIQRELAYRLSAIIYPDDPTMAYARQLIDHQAQIWWDSDQEKRERILASCRVMEPQD